jgi:GNAT superfamily N-acetyltransferase
MRLNKEITIQRAKPDEHERLTEIAHAAKRHWGYPERWIEIWKDALTITPEFVAGNEVYAAFIENEVAGFFAVIESEGKIILEHLWVSPDQMGAGVGRRLFDNALKVASSLDAHSVEIESDPHAEGFYKRMGARRIGEVVSEIEGQPRILPLLVVEVGMQN